MRLQQIITIDFHRNGISGAPFHVVLFEDRGPESSPKLGIVFDAAYHVAVLDIAKLAAGNVTFGANSWRGDVFEPSLRAAIAQWSEATDIQSGTEARDGDQP